MEYKDYKKDLEYWETHSPEAVLKYQEAFELVNDEVKEKGLDIDEWMLDFLIIHASIRDNKIEENVDYVAISSYGRAYCISNKQAKEFLEEQDEKQTIKSKAYEWDNNKTLKQ